MTTILCRGDIMGKALEAKQRRRGGLNWIDLIVDCLIGFLYLSCWVGLLDGSVGVYVYGSYSPRP
jgi:hypothetical protein